MLICCMLSIAFVFYLHRNVLDLHKLCFLSEQSAHIISVHSVFYDMFGFHELNRLCFIFKGFLNSFDSV